MEQNVLLKILESLESLANIVTGKLGTGKLGTGRPLGRPNLFILVRSVISLSR